jgi:hypothetical protein
MCERKSDVYPEIPERRQELMGAFQMSLLPAGLLLIGSFLWYMLLLVWVGFRHGRQGWAMVAASTLIGVLVALDAWFQSEPDWLFTFPVVTLILLFGGAVFGFSLLSNYSSMTTRYGWIGRLVYALLTCLLVPAILTSDPPYHGYGYLLFGHGFASVWEALCVIEGIFWLPILLYERLCRIPKQGKPATR